MDSGSSEAAEPTTEAAVVQKSQLPKSTAATTTEVNKAAAETPAPSSIQLKAEALVEKSAVKTAKPAADVVPATKQLPAVSEPAKALSEGATEPIVSAVAAKALSEGATEPIVSDVEVSTPAPISPPALADEVDSAPAVAGSATADVALAPAATDPAPAVKAQGASASVTGTKPASAPVSDVSLPVLSTKVKTTPAVTGTTPAAIVKPASDPDDAAVTAAEVKLATGTSSAVAVTADVKAVPAVAAAIPQKMVPPLIIASTLPGFKALKKVTG